MVQLYPSVSETEASVPEGKQPIEWVLLTNHDVTSVADAMQCVEWYKCRWYIEELFRILKRKGFMIERYTVGEDRVHRKEHLVCSLFGITDNHLETCL